MIYDIKEYGTIVCDDCGAINEVRFYDTGTAVGEKVMPDGFQSAWGDCWKCKLSFVKNRRKKYCE